MNFLELTKKRCSIRKFNGKPVEKKDLDLVLKAGQLAPTAVNFQPQRILVINGEKELEKLKECTTYHFDAPATLLVGYDKTVSWERKFDAKNSGEVDASIVATHMMLQAAEIGLGTTWVMNFDPEKLKEAYHIPENIVPVVLLVMGYPAEDAKPNNAHDLRHPIENTVCYNDFSAL